MDSADYEARKSARKVEADKAKAEQRAKDLEHLEALEIEHGDACVSAISLGIHKPGLPTMIVVKRPSGPEHNRFRDMVHKEKRAQALSLLADVTVAYPDAATYKQLKEEFPGIHDSVAIRALKLAQAGIEEEGKD
jgi:hypothetical protein